MNKPGDDKPQGLPFCRVCGAREWEACFYHTLKSGCPHCVPMVYARSSVAENDLGDLTQACVEEFEKSLGRNLPGRQTTIIRKHIEKVLSLRSATADSDAERRLPETLFELQVFRWTLAVLDEVEGLRRGVATTHAGVDPVARLRHWTPKHEFLDTAEAALKKAKPGGYVEREGSKGTG